MSRVVGLLCNFLDASDPNKMTIMANLNDLLKVEQLLQMFYEL